MRKRFAAIMTAAAVSAVFSMAGCSSNKQETEAKKTTEAEKTTEEKTAADEKESKEEAKDLLAEIKERGEIVIAMEGTWSPWTYHDEDDKLVGFDVEIAQKIADELGVDAKFEEGEFDGLLAGIDGGRYDIMVNGVGMDEERQEKYDFSDPYAYDKIAVIVKNDNEEIKTMEDLKGKNTANTISSTYAKVAESYGANVTGVDDLNQTFELLFSGRIDATLNAEVTYYDYMKAHPDAEIRIATLADDAIPLAIPMRKGEETASLRAAINEILDGMRESGELSELSEKYFGGDITKE